MEYKNFEVKYCPKRGENVGFEAFHQADGQVFRRCLNAAGCEPKNCEVQGAEGLLREFVGTPMEYENA